MNILERLGLKNQKKCKDIAKKRLQLVLIQDRLELSPTELSALKDDLVKVIADYMPIDRKAMEVSFQRESGAMAMVANIPLEAVRIRKDR